MSVSLPMEATVVEHCRQLKLPSVARDAGRLAVEASRQGLEPLVYLAELLETEITERAERRAVRRTKEAGFPAVKTLEGFDFGRARHLPEALIRTLTDGDYIERAENVIFVGEPGTGKTHLATALGVAAASQGRRVRFVSASRLANELSESRDALELNRVVGRYSRVDLLILDELGYLPLSRASADLMFQVLTERHERKSIVITTNLPFTEWTTVFQDPRLCRAVVDRLTATAHIIDTGTESNRLKNALANNKRSKKKS